jgi:hypothetical protein
MTSYTLSPVWGAGAQLFDNSGNVLTGGKIETYEAGTTTPAATYTNPTGNTFNSNPIVADASGRLSNEIWLIVGGAYKFVLKDANNVLIATYDNIPSSPQPPITNDASSISYEQGYTVTAGAFTVGATYRITSVGTTNFVAIGAAANATGVLFTATGVGSGTGTAEYSRTVQAKLRETVSVKDFGATGDGVTDDTAAIQTAMTNSANRQLYFPAGTYIVTSLTGVSDLEIVGENQEATIFKRKNNDASTSPMFNFSSKSKVKFTNLTFDGNKASQTNTQALLNFDACENIVVDNCTLKNAKTNNGINITNGTTAINNEQFVVENCTIKNCDLDAIYISKTSFIVVNNNLLKDNGASGVTAINFVFPPVQFVQNYISITNNRCLNNTGSGISFVGAYIGGTSGAPIPGSSVPPQKGILISGNTCISNDQYGIAFQGYGGVIDGNYCEKNGASAAYGGINAALCEATLITNNVCYDNYAWGIDLGGSVNTSCNNNNISYTGLTSAFPSVASINFGGCVQSQCNDNVISYNGGVNSASIYVSGIEFGGGSYFDQIGQNITIANNNITLLDSTSIGIYITNGTTGVSLVNNQIYAASPNKAFLLEGGQSVFEVVNKSNIDWANGGVLPSIASATSTVIPDNNETFQITGTTNITSLYTYSANVYKNGVRFIQITNGGSGYNPASPPSVTIAPPGSGTTATGTALVGNSGKVIGVQITNIGSGYTTGSNPAVTFGSGSAAGTAFVGCNNYQAKIITLIFNGALTVTSGNNLFLASNFTTAAGGGSTLTLMGAFGNWYELSRKV